MRQTDSGTFTVGIGQRYDSVYVRNGTVPVEGFTVDYPMPPRDEPTPEAPPRSAGDKPYVAPSSIFTAVATQSVYDVGELALSTYVQARDQGQNITALPVFPSHAFPHRLVYVSPGAGIEKPIDLVGKRVGVGSFSKNYAVWFRGALVHQYQVPIEEIVWVEDQPEHFSAFRAPDRFQVERLEPGVSQWQLLEAGEIDAAIGPEGMRRVGPTVRPLFPDPYPDIHQYVRMYGFFPINTVLTVPLTALEKSQQFPRAVFETFQKALDLYRNAVRDGTREDAHSGLSVRRLEGELGLPFPDYGFKANRATIETMIRYCLEQGIIKRRFTPEELFLLTDT